MTGPTIAPTRPTPEPQPTPDERKEVGYEIAASATMPSWLPMMHKVLCSSAFKTADSLRELLRFTVHETMAGRGGELKEYLFAMTVLGKPDSFDPKADSIVRAQMRRLREHLRRYYATEGRYDPVLIDIPKGTYMPTFRRATRDGGAAVPAGTEEGFIVGRQKRVDGSRHGCGGS